MKKSIFKLLAGAFTCFICFAAPAAAQDMSMKECGEKWQAAKASGSAAGSTWPKFLAECRAGKLGDGKAMSADNNKVDAKPNAKTSETAKASAPQPKGKIEFPTSISPKHSSLAPSKARMKTCSEQYQANKASGSNGGLRWLEKGGGYWSLCNAKLKG
jgi:hypothetical protein